MIVACKAIIISDLHLGSQHCLADELLRFLGTLDSDTPLILNGDVIDRWHTALPPAHQEALDTLVRESHGRRVVWIRGNHDDNFTLENSGCIEFCRSFRMGSLIAAHGDYFDTRHPSYALFVRVFRWLHDTRIRLGAESVHVALYAKRFPALYRILLDTVRTNAVKFARENGCPAVTCGHTHYAEDAEIEGIRYINTGSWTETPIHFLVIEDDNLQLKVFDSAIEF